MLFLWWPFGCPLLTLSLSSLFSYFKPFRGMIDCDDQMDLSVRVNLMFVWDIKVHFGVYIEDEKLKRLSSEYCSRFGYTGYPPTIFVWRGNE